jgi:hypothetical protein
LRYERYRGAYEGDAMKPIAGLSVLLCLLGAACSPLQVPPPALDPTVRAVRIPGAEPMPFAVVVPPLEADLEGIYAPGADEYPVAHDMAAIMEVAKIFGAVRAVPLLADGKPAVPPDADFILRLRAHKLEVKYEGRNNFFIPNLLLWGAFIFPAWWVPDETYSGKVDLEAVLVSTRSGNRVGSHTASVVLTRDLDDFERGWFPLGIFLAPAAFSRGNWKCVGREVLRPAIRMAQVDLAKWLNGEFRKRVDAGEVDILSATTFALASGISKYENTAVPPLDRPWREATVLTQFLSDPQLGGVLPSRARLLVDADATREGIMAALEDTLVNEPKAPDTALVYLSGHGTVDRSGGKITHALLTHDTDPADPASPRLTLKDLKNVVSRSRAGRVIVVIDTGFTGGPKARGLGVPPNEEKTLRRVLGEMVVRGRGFVILVERTGGAGRTDFLPDFTAALAGKADLDGDGAVTGAEMKELFSRTTPPGGSVIRFFGENLESVRIPFARGRSK